MVSPSTSPPSYAALISTVGSLSSSAAILAQHGGAEGLRQAIENEHYRERFNVSAIDRLQAASLTWEPELWPRSIA
ncbi:hypothetical protein DWF00_16525 [Bosea caraganae]|uniref:Uncharacterized protein n=1 Tax=Bosea caraganae TaxID=2763117 RepID=A0A370KYV9_9HYPH|nr:hypothetical protein DWE98_26130 [Bosea caraganae]RDJ24828.1 hypothetical protein DWF00_16525 [Bosea caraganae]